MSFSKRKWRLSTIQVVQCQEPSFVFCIQFNSNIYLHEAFKNTYLTALIQEWEIKEKAPALSRNTSLFLAVCYGLFFEHTTLLSLKGIFFFKKKRTFGKIQSYSGFSRQVVSHSCNPTDCSLPGSSVHGISQARILEWVAISSSRGSSWPRDWACICFIGNSLWKPP